jgi:D-alanine-D-alanine ligase
VAGRLSVAVVEGGASSEAEVSRASARAVSEALIEAGHGVVRLELDGQLSESLRGRAFDVAFPLAHGAMGEDGALQGVLEVQGLPYVGSGILASALAMDKTAARRVFAMEGLPVARGIAVRRPMEESALLSHARVALDRALAEVGPRLVVKPSSQGSALGVARFGEEAPPGDIAAAIVAAWRLDDVVLLEHFARGRELTCGVLDVNVASSPGLGPGQGAGQRGPVGPLVLPPTEILSPEDPFYTYEARYSPGRSVHICPAEIGESLTQVVQAMALAAHRALGCRDLSRVDFILGDQAVTNTLTLLEVNTLPGFTATSLYPEAAARAGIPLARLCDSLVRAAHERGPTRRTVGRPLP